MADRVLRSRRSAFGLGAAFLGAALLSALSSAVLVEAREVPPATGPAWFEAAQVRAPQSFLGFEVGEERRYVLGPPGSLAGGEYGNWSIKLDAIDGDGAGQEATFSLSHEWQGPQGAKEWPLRTVTKIESSGTIRVNEYGFPLFIRFDTKRRLYGAGNEAYSVDYRLEDDAKDFEKQTTRGGKRWYQGVRIRGDYEIQGGVPAGVLAFLPGAPGCYGVLYPNFAVGATPPQVNAPGSSGAAPVGSPTGAPGAGREADNADCEESLFANPGLLNFAVPALWEAQGTRDFVFFTPLGPTSEPALTVGAVVPAGSGAGLLPPNSPPPERDMGARALPGSMQNALPRVDGTPLSPYDHNEFRGLEYVERTAVNVGGRIAQAWMVAVSEGLGPFYVDDDGRILRVDLVAPGEGGERYIRMLWPSEF